jgi:hypothetical protein
MSIQGGLQAPNITINTDFIIRKECIVKFIIGLAVGICFVLAAGAVEHYFVTVEGEFEKVGIFQPAFSGVSAEGNCYLAITNSKTGRTEVFAITKDSQKKFSENPLQMSREGSVIVEPQDSSKR